MPLISIVMALIIVGVILWLIGLLPIEAKIKTLINGLVIVVVILWLLSLFVGGLGTFHVGR